MKFEHGNLNDLNANQPDQRGWVVGSFIQPSSLRHSEQVEMKWVTHQKGLKKAAGAALEKNAKTMVILLEGKWLTVLNDRDSVLLEQPGDFLIYEAQGHQNEALEDTKLIIVRWKEAIL